MIARLLTWLCRSVCEKRRLLDLNELCHSDIDPFRDSTRKLLALLLKESLESGGGLLEIVVPEQGTDVKIWVCARMPFENEDELPIDDTRLALPSTAWIRIAPFPVEIANGVFDVFRQLAGAEQADEGYLCVTHEGHTRYAIVRFENHKRMQVIFTDVWPASH